MCCVKVTLGGSELRRPGAIQEETQCNGRRPGARRMTGHVHESKQLPLTFGNLITYNNIVTLLPHRLLPL